MAEIINMNDHQQKPIKPKTEGKTYNGHRYILSFNPNASLTDRWHWSLKFTRVMEFTGTAATIEAAEKAAKKQVDHMEGRSHRAAS